MEKHGYSCIEPAGDTVLPHSIILLVNLHFHPHIASAKFFARPVSYKNLACKVLKVFFIKQREQENGVGCWNKT